MITPNWDDINKLEEQNKQMRFWIEQQRNYIKALQRLIPTALMEDWAPNLPTLPNIPHTLDVCVPQRMLKNPVEGSPTFNINFTGVIDKPILPPRGSLNTAQFRITDRKNVENVDRNDQYYLTSPEAMTTLSESVGYMHSASYFSRDRRHNQKNSS